MTWGQVGGVGITVILVCISAYWWFYQCYRFGYRKGLLAFGRARHTCDYCGLLFERGEVPTVYTEAHTKDEYWIHADCLHDLNESLTEREITESEFSRQGPGVG